MADDSQDDLAELERKRRDREQRDADDIRHVLSTDRGRRVVWWMLERGSVFATTFNADPHISAFNEGQRNLALALFSRVVASCPEQYLQMAEEASREEKT
ncbi:hypothetical protein BL252_06560 [Salmonella enterica]|nr:hypothetical protein [Salmonella enterica]EBR4546839.1 hypothetical protein [Salmonella enterica]